MTHHDLACAPRRALQVLVALWLMAAMTLVPQAAHAAEIPGVISNVRVLIDTNWDGEPDTPIDEVDDVSPYVAIGTYVDWCVPNDADAQAGDTFSLQLPAALEPPGGFDLRDDDDNLVAVATVDATTGLVTFTLTEYVESHASVCGTAFFVSDLVEHGYDTDYDLTYTVDGTTTYEYTLSTGPFVGRDRTEPAKYGSWTDDDEDRIRWTIETPNGPWDDTVIVDDLGADAPMAFDCSSIVVRLVNASDTTQPPVGVGTLTTADYTVTSCTPERLELVVHVDSYFPDGDMPDGYFATVAIQADITDPTLDSYRNDVEVTVDEEESQTAGETEFRTSAGGEGGGVIPSVDIEKFDTDGNDADTADESVELGLSPGSTELEFIITNDGEEPLTDVTVSDTVNTGGQVEGLTCDFDADGTFDGIGPWSGPFVDGADNFEPGAVFTCVATLTGVEFGAPHHDTATVTAVSANDPTVTVDDDDDYHAEAQPIYDLAIQKLGPGTTVAVGDTATFTVTVFNQGDVDSGAVTLLDTLPAGTSLADIAANDGWDDNGDGTASRSIDNIVAGGNLVLEITLVIDEWVADGYVNDVEIDSDSGDDIDSTPDDDPTNDVTTDDEYESTPDGDPADEDDHDPAPLDVAVPSNTTAPSTSTPSTNPSVTTSSTTSTSSTSVASARPNHPLPATGGSQALTVAGIGALLLGIGGVALIAARRRREQRPTI